MCLRSALKGVPGGFAEPEQVQAAVRRARQQQRRLQRGRREGQGVDRCGHRAAPEGLRLRRLRLRALSRILVDSDAPTEAFRLGVQVTAPEPHSRGQQVLRASLHARQCAENLSRLLPD